MTLKHSFPFSGLQTLRRRRSSPIGPNQPFLPPPERFMQIRSRRILLLTLLLLLAFALRVYHVDQKSLWLDEVYTFNDSRDGFKEQLHFYKENPAFLHPPLFFLLTHSFYPFTKPERDLRMIPMIAGTLSIPAIYLVAGSFSPPIALPCAFSLAFMTYHISLSQDGRAYSFLLLLGMIGLYFFMTYLRTFKKRYLFLVALSFALMLHTSYSSIPFVAFSQLLWLYRTEGAQKRPPLAAFFFLNGLVTLLCLPWALFVFLHYKGQVVMDPFHTEGSGSLASILSGTFSDWAPSAPLTLSCVLLFILFPLFSRDRKNAFVLLATLFFPIIGLYCFCRLFNVTHFVTSRYFITFLPFFFITLFLSLSAIEAYFQKLKRLLRPTLLFLILFLASNLIILPLYYHYQKQDLRGLVAFLKTNLREGDTIVDHDMAYVPGILHYFGIYPEGRHYSVLLHRISATEYELQTPFTYQGKRFVIFSSPQCCSRYLEYGNRLWIVSGKRGAKELGANPLFVLLGFFDGSFLNFDRFPTDASLYLFCWDPSSPGQKGLDIQFQ